MIDPKAVRTDPDAMREAIRVRKVDPAKANVDRWLALDARRQKLQQEIDENNKEKRAVARSGRIPGQSEDWDIPRRQRGQILRERGRVLELELETIVAEWQGIMDWFPNWPHPDMPAGASEEDNVEENAWIPGQGYLAADKLGRGNTSAQYMPTRPLHAQDDAFEPLHHSDLGVKLGGINTLQGGQVSGSRFAYLRGDVARMQYALSQLLIDELLTRGYEMLVPPLLVRERSLYGTSHFPEGRDQVYAIKTDNVEEGAELFLVGSSEPANFSYFMEQTLDAAELPVKLFAYTACFRSEAGSWGQDVKGIKRMHQFDKIEMNAVCLPDQSAALYEEFGQINEWLLQELALPYRVVDKCHGDAGYLASHRQRDMEVWMSGTGEFMEVMTDTNATDYQARRLNIRYKGAGGRGFCHLVNDTGCAMGRLLIAILDNYQQPDGAVQVPEALQRVVQKSVLQPKGA